MSDTSNKVFKGYSTKFKNGSECYYYNEFKTTLESGFYEPAYDGYEAREYLKKLDIVMPKLYDIPNGMHKKISDDITKFWNSREIYEKFGLVYKRNILLYSVPGNGKTSLINAICNKLVTEHNGIVILIRSIEGLTNYHGVIKSFRLAEPDRKVITIMEDFDDLANEKRHVSTILNILDGVMQCDNVVTFATTNNPEVLEKRFVCRPSRFNLCIEYEKPDADVRKFYITEKMKELGIDVKKKENKKYIDHLVARTNGYTFDFVKETMQGIFVEGTPEDDLFTRLNNLIDSKGKLKITEKINTSGGIGFIKNTSSSPSYGHSIGRPLLEIEGPDDDYDE